MGEACPAKKAAYFFARKKRRFEPCFATISAYARFDNRLVSQLLDRPSGSLSHHLRLKEGHVCRAAWDLRHLAGSKVQARRLVLVGFPTSTGVYV